MAFVDVFDTQTTALMVTRHISSPQYADENRKKMENGTETDEAR